MGKIRIAFVAGLVSWLLLKLYGLGTWTWDQSDQAGMFLNLAFVTGIAAYAAYCHRNAEGFFHRWKPIARVTLLYSLSLCLVMGLWYYVLVPETIELRKQEQLDMLRAFVDDADQLQAMKDGNPALSAMSANEIFEQQAANIEVFFSPIFFLGTVLMVWIFSGALLSALFTALMPRIWNR